MRQETRPNHCQYLRTTLACQREGRYMGSCGMKVSVEMRSQWKARGVQGLSQMLVLVPLCQLEVMKRCIPSYMGVIHQDVN